MIAVVLLVAILFAGNGMLVTHAAGPNGQGNGNGNHSNSGNGNHSGTGNSDHSSGSNNGDSSHGSGNGGHSSGSGTGDSSGTGTSVHTGSGTNKPTSQQLSLDVAGGVVDVGGQHYIILQSGSVMSASFMTYSIDPSTSHFNYHLNAMVQGTSVTGNANFHLSGSLVGGGTIEISGIAHLVGSVAAVCLPNYDSPNSDGTCPSGDTSEVPAFFMGMASIQATIAGKEQSMTQVPMLFQSAYLNPFGAPIVLGTANNFATMQIVTTYNHATIDWSNIVDQALVSGTFGSESVTGMFTQVAQEHENLVTGNAKDHGTINFTMSDSTLDSFGHYSGSSMTPLTPNTDCSALVGVACTNYGFDSTGSFHSISVGPQNVQISGSYGTTWGIPAFSFTGTITASVSK